MVHAPSSPAPAPLPTPPWGALAPRARNLRPNGILAIAIECRRRQARGQDVVDLTVGEPEFGIPGHVAEAAARAVAEGRTRYTAPAGMPQLRAAMCRQLIDEGLNYLTNEVMATCGAAGALTCALQALVAPGDEVVIPVPFYPDHPVQVLLAAGAAALVETDASSGHKLTPRALRGRLTPRSRVLILNNPANPTGAVYERQELEALAEVALAAGLFIVADEVYANLVYEGAAFTSIGALGPDVRSRSLVVRSLSKTHAMTGWRIGLAAGPQFLIEAMASIQGASLVSPSTVSQWAAVAALTGPQEAPRAMRDALSRRREQALFRLSAMPGVCCVPSRGGLFLFADLGLGDTGGFCRKALDVHGVAVVPGHEFGAPSFVRISFARPEAELHEGFDRLARALSSVNA